MSPPSAPSPAPSSASDEALWAAAAEAAAGDGLPATIGGCRRRALLAHDDLSTCWSGWDLTTGAAVWLCILRPRWTPHPAMVRRFSEPAATAGVRGFATVRGCVLPMRRLDRPGPTLRELAPQVGEGEVGLPLRAAALAHGLHGLTALHRVGRSPGGALADWVVVSADGPRVVDRIPFRVPHDPDADLRSLAAAVVALAPEATDPIAALARAWCDRPPPTSADGAHLVARAMATHLAWLRHQLVRSRRSHTRGSRLGRLSRLIRRLHGVQAPPSGRAILAVGPDDQQVQVWSDGETLRGGAVLAGVPADLPLVWSAAGGLDPVTGRLLVRSWSSCRGEDKQRAQAAHAALGAEATDPQLFVRWLKAARRLRSARLLLDAEARVRVVR